MSSDIKITYPLENESGKRIQGLEDDTYIRNDKKLVKHAIRICICSAFTLVMLAIAISMSIYFWIQNVHLSPLQKSSMLSNGTRASTHGHDSTMKHRNEFLGGTSGQLTSSMPNRRTNAPKTQSYTSPDTKKQFFDDKICCSELYLDLNAVTGINGRYKMQSEFNGRGFYKSVKSKIYIFYHYYKGFWAIGTNPKERNIHLIATSVCNASCVQDCSSNNWKTWDMTVVHDRLRDPESNLLEYISSSIRIVCLENTLDDVDPCSDHRPLNIAHSSTGEISFPDYSRPYSGKGRCDWHISGEVGYNIKITILELDLAKGSLLCIVDGEDALSTGIEAYYGPIFQNSLETIFATG